ncbi:hypothetical protein LCGC14_2151000, partial [marine sediment metagenome]
MRVVRIRWLIAMGLMETAQICIDSLWDKLTYDRE